MSQDIKIENKAEFNQFVLVNYLRWLTEEEKVDLCFALYVRCDRKKLQNLIKKYDEKNTNIINNSFSK